MKEEVWSCDIKDMAHKGGVATVKIGVIFDYDQNDGKLKVDPYIQNVEIETRSF